MIKNQLVILDLTKIYTLKFNKKKTKKIKIK